MARANSEKYFQRPLDKNKEENLPRSDCTLAEKMRDQPKASSLVYSPRRPGTAVENTVEMLNKSTKPAIPSDDSSSSTNISLFLHGHHERKSLQILQPSADGQKLLVGGRTNRKTKNKKQVKEGSQSRLKQVKLHLATSSIEIDSPSSSSDLENGPTHSSTEVQTSSDEAYSLMVQDRAPEKYWELVAEERRKALEETLHENMKLHEKIEELKAENKALQEKASDTDYYATMYKIVKDDILPPPEASPDV